LTASSKVRESSGLRWRGGLAEKEKGGAFAVLEKENRFAQDQTRRRL
jgi:hypothetical protein